MRRAAHRARSSGAAAVLALALVACAGAASSDTGTLRGLARADLACEELTVRDTGRSSSQSASRARYVVFGCGSYARYDCDPECRRDGYVRPCDPEQDARELNESLKQSGDVDAETPFDFDEGPCVRDER